MTEVNYNAISQVYDQVRTADRELLDNLITTAKLSEQSVILDIGCGTANYTSLIQKVTGAEIYGVDSSAGMIGKAKEKNDQICFKVNDVDCEKLSFEDSFFDLIYMTDVIHHLTNYQHFFYECKRVLKERGLLCIGTQSHRQIDKRYMTEFFPATAIVDKKRYPDLVELCSFVKKVGLQYHETVIVGEDQEVELGQQFKELIEKKGYSMLHLITDDDYQRGLELVTNHLQSGSISRKAAGGSLVWFRKSTY